MYSSRGRIEPTIPVANFSSNVNKGYTPLSVKFNDISENVIEWGWDFGDRTGSIEQNPIHAYSLAGIYTVKLTASNDYGTASKTAKITVMKKHRGSGGSVHHHSSQNSGEIDGAGISREPPKNVEVKEISQTFVTNEKSAKFNFPKNSTSVVYVGFDSKKSLGKTSATVEMLKGKSALVSDLPSDETYKFFNIWLGNSGIAIVNNMENAVICFKVDKAWIKDNNINQASIVLNRYSDKKWEQLPTSQQNGDENIFTSQQKPQVSLHLQ